MEVSARLDIEVFVDCPHCGYMIDLLKEDETDGQNHNDEGYILAQACPSGLWIDEHEKFEVDEVTCTKCKTTFNVKGLEW
ncbi:MAG: hypothetical protein KAT04_14440 [Methylococcales bacterium]|nr:hypothetical protein [Methylococcales bacterium]